MTEPKILLKIIDSHGKVKRVSTRKPRRIYCFLKANSFQDCLFNLRVIYKNDIENEGVYQTKGELTNTLKDFLEADT
jgi:hypothetical protein